MPKYINPKTGEVTCTLAQTLESSLADLKHFKLKALRWIFCWKRYDPERRY
jgi:hypothetical protein